MEIFHYNQRRATHVRILILWTPVYVLEHIPEVHQCYFNYDEEGFQQWAEGIGPLTETVIRILPYMHSTPQQGYKSCVSR